MIGHIEGIQIGAHFNSRKDLANSGLHTPPVSGIAGCYGGAYSIVLSGGYEDDIDELDYILYTGQGGRNPSSGKQIAHQEFVRGNKGLQLSCQYNLPVRVIRGHQIDNGPSEGYRYDGLYFVTKFERILGVSGFYICRFHLQNSNWIKQFGKESNSESNSNDETNRITRPVNTIQRNVNFGERLKKYTHIVAKYVMRDWILHVGQFLKVLT